MRTILLLVIFSFFSNNLLATNYFPINYNEGRKSFIELSTFHGGELLKEIVKSKIDKDLTIDVSYFPAKSKKEKLIILTSGVHGPESYLGSAAQKLFLEKYLSKINRDSTAILLVHSLNPYGFKYGRRANEDNIDLNRNMSVTNDLFSIPNTGHKSMIDVLAPKGNVESMFLGRLVWSLLKKLMRGVSISEIRNGITSGQYEHSKSIYFGGNQFSQQRTFLRELYIKYTKDFSKILALDFHTGLGTKGQLHLISGGSEKLSDVSIKAQKKIFSSTDDVNYQLTTSDTPGFYGTTGDMNDFLAEICGKTKLVIALTAEFGTMGLGLPKQIESLNRMIKENQGHFWGYKDKIVEQNVKTSFIDLFNPNEKKWRAEVIKKLNRIFSVEINRFTENFN
jgi:predicted deacylase